MIYNVPSPPPLIYPYPLHCIPLVASPPSPSPLPNLPLLTSCPSSFHCSLLFPSALQLTKITSVQETGVASGLVEVIQGCGFAVQTLSLSFDDEVEAEAEFFKAFRASGAPLAGAAEAAVVLE